MTQADAAPGAGEEQAVVAAVRSGGSAEFSSLTERYRRELLVHRYRMVGNLEDAEDLVQETFLRACVGTLTWMAFLPFALAFGFLSKHSGVHTAAWMIVAASIATCTALARLALSRHPRAITSRWALPQTTDQLTVLAHAEC